MNVIDLLRFGRGQILITGEGAIHSQMSSKCDGGNRDRSQPIGGRTRLEDVEIRDGTRSEGL